MLFFVLLRYFVLFKTVSYTDLKNKAEKDCKLPKSRDHLYLIHHRAGASNIAAE